MDEIRKLIEQLSDPERKRVRQAAQLALARIGEPAIPFLIEVLEDVNVNFAVKELAREPLVEIGKPAIPPLIETLVNGDCPPQIQAIRALGEIKDPLLPAGKFDVVYMINTYHHIDYQEDILRNILPSLKPGGIMVIIENEPTKSGWDSYTTPKEELIDKATKTGYELDRIETFLAEDNIYIFKPAGIND